MISCGKHIRAARREHGFSLLEFVIGLALLAMLMALLPSTLRFAKRAATFARELSVAKASAATSMSAVEELLGQAMPQFEKDDTGAMRVAFSGAARSLSFVAPLLGAPHGAGLYRLTLEQRSPDGGRRSELLLRTAPWTADTNSESSVAKPVQDERILAVGSTPVRFRYFGFATGQSIGAWHDVWPRTDRLPDLVEIVVPRTSSQGSQDAPVVVELQLRQRHHDSQAR